MAAAAGAHPDSGGPVLVGDAATLPVADGAADCVVAFMSLQDVDAMERAIAETGRVLCTGGCLVVAITHQANTAGHFASESDGRPPPFVIQGSWFERRALADTCERDGLTMTFHSEHRPLVDYVDALADGGFLIERIREVGDPDPDDKWHRDPAVPPPARREGLSAGIPVRDRPGSATPAGWSRTVRTDGWIRVYVLTHEEQLRSSAMFAPVVRVPVPDADPATRLIAFFGS